MRGAVAFIKKSEGEKKKKEFLGDAGIESHAVF